MSNYLLQHYVQQAAAACPEAIAIVDEWSTITYRELDEKSEALGRTLVNSGVTPGSTVGVYLEKSISAVVAFVAVLKTGACYIPLDSRYSPPERIRTIIVSSRMRFVVTSAPMWSTIVKNPAVGDIAEQCIVVTIDNLPKATGEACFNLTPQAASENDLAYLLYTSGSTGIPKGVMITHRNAMAFVEWAVQEFRLPSGTVFANHAPFHFDLSVFDLYAAFATQGTVHLVPHAIANNPRSLIQWIGAHAIEVWYSVPSVWMTILHYASIDTVTLDKLHTILFAGEVFPPKHLEKLMRQLPDRRYYNLYGPTETNVCTFYRVGSAEEIGDEPVPIGSACANAHVMALDESMHEVPVGDTGELYVRGPTVAAGYYNDPEKTAASFLFDPASSGGHERMYATGDIVRRTACDEYTYVGRKDLMVKCAGFRIELQEIEKVLCAMPGVREAVVVACKDAIRETVALHACIAPAEGIDIMIMDVKKACREKLPHYMIPDRVLMYSSLPKNQNGKIDRCLLAKQCEDGSVT